MADLMADEGSSAETNPFLRERIMRKLETLSNERLYQVLDYVEFLESRYAQRQAAPASVFQRFTDGLEDTMRAGRLSADAIAQTMGLMNRAMGVLSGVAAAGKSVASEVVNAASRPAPRPPSPREAHSPPPGEPPPPPSTEPGEPPT
ncbi:MAG: hypothetical protein ACT4PJ_00940 [Gemmatimonadaceae bacterium]